MIFIPVYRKEAGVKKPKAKTSGSSAADGERKGEAVVGEDEVRIRCHNHEVLTLRFRNALHDVHGLFENKFRSGLEWRDQAV